MVKEYNKLGVISETSLLIIMYSDWESADSALIEFC